MRALVLSGAVAVIALTGCRTVRPQASQQPRQNTEQTTGQVEQPIDSQQSQTSPDSTRAVSK